MSEIERRYRRGESIPSKDLNNPQGLALYGEVIHFDWRQDKATQSPDLFGEVHHQKVKPEKPQIERPTLSQESHERCADFQMAKEWQIPMLTRRVKTIEPYKPPVGWGQRGDRTPVRGWK